MRPGRQLRKPLRFSQKSEQEGVAKTRFVHTLVDMAHQRIVGVIGSRVKDKDNNNLLGKLVHRYMVNDKNINQIIWLSGGASTGADYWVRKYCSDYRLQYLEAPAFWSQLYRYKDGGDFDKTAGLRRNSTIATVCTELWAFWDQVSRGTMDTVSKVRNLGKPIRMIDVSRIHPVDNMVLPKKPPSSWELRSTALPLQTHPPG